jgi:hypothetical protein
MRRKTAAGSQTDTVDGMYVCAAIQEQFYNITCRSRDGSVQRRTSSAVPTI